MKLFVALSCLLLASIAAGNPIVKTYNSIDDFMAKNQGAKLIKMEAVDHEIDGSRSYAVGGRQTGKQPRDSTFSVNLIVRFHFR